MLWNPEDYAKHSDAQLLWARELQSRHSWQGNEAILDVGCGDGKITADFATNTTSRVVGVDSSPEMIAYATQTYPPSQYPNLAFACVDAQALTFDHEFDLVFSNSSLHWVEDHPAFLKGARLALCDRGQLMISCGGQGNAADVLQTFVEVTTQANWRQYFGNFRNPYFFYGPQEYEPWLKAAGFEVQQLELVAKDMTHEGKVGLAAWIRTTWMPFTNCVPAHQRDQFIEEFVDAYLEKIPLDSQGLAHVKMVRLEVDASVNNKIRKEMNETLETDGV